MSEKILIENFHIAKHLSHARPHGIWFLLVLTEENTFGPTSVNQEVSGETDTKL